MIRNARYHGAMRSLPLLLIAVALLLTSLPAISHAGDQDGLGGYSMQLKRKYFDGTGSGSGGSGQVIYPDPKSNEGTYSAQMTTVELSSARWMVDLHRCLALVELWLR